MAWKQLDQVYGVVQEPLGLGRNGVLYSRDGGQLYVPLEWVGKRARLTIEVETPKYSTTVDMNGIGKVGTLHGGTVASFDPTHPLGARVAAEAECARLNALEEKPDSRVEDLKGARKVLAARLMKAQAHEQGAIIREMREIGDEIERLTGQGND